MSIFNICLITGGIVVILITSTIRIQRERGISVLQTTATRALGQALPIESVPVQQGESGGRGYVNISTPLARVLLLNTSALILPGFLIALILLSSVFILVLDLFYDQISPF